MGAGHADALKMGSVRVVVVVVGGGGVKVGSVQVLGVRGVHANQLKYVHLF